MVKPLQRTKKHFLPPACLDGIYHVVYTASTQCQSFELSFTSTAVGLQRPGSRCLLRVIFMQKRFGEALHLHGRALTILEKTLGVGHPDVAEALVSKAWCLTELVSVMVSATQLSSLMW